MDVRVISIGTLGAHPLWNEPSSRPPRSGHATCTLIRVEAGPGQRRLPAPASTYDDDFDTEAARDGGDRVILVDPGLPPSAIVARLFERTGLRPEQVTDVFLTSFQPDTRRGIRSFSEAAWWIAEREKETLLPPLEAKRDELRSLDDEGDNDLLDAIEDDIAVLRRCRVAPDRLAEGVDLFPLPGVTPGTAGLLIAEARRTTLICGDAVATGEHLDRGMILPNAIDPDTAQESFREAVEIADVLIPGRDNAVLNPTRSSM